MIDKKVCYKISKYKHNQDGRVLDKVRIDNNDFYMIENKEQCGTVDKVAPTEILYIIQPR